MIAFTVEDIILIFELSNADSHHYENESRAREYDDAFIK